MEGDARLYNAILNKKDRVRKLHEEAQNLSFEIQRDELAYRITCVASALEGLRDLSTRTSSEPQLLGEIDKVVVACLNKLKGNTDGVECKCDTQK